MQAITARKIELTAVIIGILLGVLKFVLPFSLFIEVAGALAVAVCILWKVEVGVFFVIGLTPFFPTMVLVGLVLLCLAALGLKLFMNREYFLKDTSMDMFILLFVGILVYGSLTSFAYLNSIQIALVYISFISFFVVMVNTIKTKQQLYALVALFVISAFVVSLYGIYQNYTVGSTAQAWVDEEMFEYIKARVYSTFDNPNVLGEYLVIMIPISLALLWSAKRWFHRLVFGGITGAMLLCLVFTWSRGSWLGVMLALGIFALLRDKRLVALGAAGVMALPFLVPTSIISRLSSIGNLEDSSSAYRLSIWQGSLKIIKDYWPSGIGLGSEAFSKIYPLYALPGAGYALHAHNLYLQILVETGFLGLILFLLVLAMFYKSALSAYWKTKDYFLSTFMAALIAGMTGYLFQGLVDNIWFNYRMVLIFWIMIAFSAIGFKIINSGKCQGDSDV